MQTYRKQIIAIKKRVLKGAFFIDLLGIFIYNDNVKEINKERRTKDMRYLVTDPCYIVPNDQWSDYCDGFYGDSDTDISMYNIKDFGTIVEVDNTANGDGSVNLGGGKKVLVDAGVVCLVRLNAGVTPTAYQGNAITSNLATAYDWYKKAKNI